MATYFKAPAQVLKDSVLHVDGINSTSTMFYRGGFTFTSPGGSVFSRDISEAPPQKLPNGNWDLWWTANKDLGSPTSELGVWNCLFKSEYGSIQENFTYKVVDKIDPEPEPAWKIKQNDIDSFSSEHATLKINGANAYLNAPIIRGDILTAVPESGYKLTGVSASGIGGDGSDVVLNFTKKEDGTWEVTFPDVESLLTFSFSVTSELIPVKVYTFIEQDFYEPVLVYLNDSPAAVGMEAFIGDVIKVTCKRGFQFTRKSDGSPVLPILAASNGGGSRFTYVSGSSPDSATLKLESPSGGATYGKLDIQTELIDFNTPEYKWTVADVNYIKNAGVTLVVGGAVVTAGSVARAGYSVSMTANDGYVIKSASLDWKNSDPTILTVSADGLTATGTIGASVDVEGGLYLNFVTEQTGAPQYEYSLTQTDINDINSAHVTMFINGKKAGLGSGVNRGDNLSITSNDGWLIISATISRGIWDPIVFNISPNGKSGSVTIDTGYPPSDPFSGFAINFVTEQETPEIKGEFNNIYKVDKDIMSAVNKERWVYDPNSDNPVEYRDYGSNIINLLHLPFAIPEDYILGASPIQLGDKGLNVSANKISKDLVRVDLGSIVVNGEFKDSLDYVGTTALLHIPRANPISIDLEYVIGCTLGITYDVDLYSGRATVNITSSKIDDVILTKDIEFGFNIPFNGEFNNSPDNLNIELTGDNGVSKPFIELVKTDLILPKGFYTIPVIDEGKLNGYNGFVQVDEMELKTKATAAERDLIQSQLSEGVIIK